MQTHLRRPHQLFALPVRYEIPGFQRRYVWTQEEQWEPLWEDVAALAQSILEECDPSDTHFMGALVLQPVQFPAGSLDSRIVVDGQQRLTTIQILLDAVQEVLDDRGCSDPAKRLQGLVENAPEYRDGDEYKALKVRPTTVDRDAFHHAMRNHLSGAEYATSPIVQAHEYFKAQAGHWLDKFEASKRAAAASALERALRTGLEFVVIDLGDSDDAHLIFETLNARGTPLLQSDMVKNRLLFDSDEAAPWPFGDDWWAERIGRGLQRRPRIDVFLNHWLTLRNQSETKAYNEFRVFTNYADARCRNGQSTRGKTALAIARDIADIGRIYCEVEQPGGRKEIASFLERRNVMNVGVITPLLLWLLSSNVPPRTLACCLRALESWLVRRVVCGYSARSYGKVFVGLIVRLAKSPVEQADRIVVEYLAEQTGRGGLWPDDRALCDVFVAEPLYQWLTQGRLRMVLMAIEEHLRTVEAESQEAPRDLQIEHIMPQSWREHWSLREGTADHEAITKRDRAVHTIGNLTLVNGHLNPELSNSAWEVKRKGLAEYSVMFLNKRLVNEGPDTWDEQEIKNRARWLHEQAIQVWPHARGFDVG